MKRRGWPQVKMIAGPYNQNCQAISRPQTKTSILTDGAFGVFGTLRTSSGTLGDVAPMFYPVLSSFPAFV